MYRIEQLFPWGWSDTILHGNADGTPATFASFEDAARELAEVKSLCRLIRLPCELRVAEVKPTT